MKRIYQILVLFALTGTLMFSGCKEKPDPDAKGTIEFKVVPNFNGSNFIFNQDAQGRDGRNYRINYMRYFLSNIYLVKADNTTEKISDVILVNEENSSTRSVTAEVPIGDYTGVSFGIGLDASRNAMDPANFSFDQPQGDLSMYWTWASKYIFLKYEGLADTTGISGSTDQSYFFHVGGDAYYHLTNYNQAVTVSDGETVTIEVPVDYDLIINGATYVDVKSDYATHTGDNVPLAVKVMDNMVGAFTR